MQSDPNKLSVFPAFVKVAGKTVIVVGGGDEAVAKLRLLSQTSADLVVIAANPTDQMTALVKQVGATLLERAYTFEDLADAALVFTALETAAEDRCVVEAARLAGVPVNAVDRPDMCDFITPAMVNRAPVTVAISTSGAAPVLARRIKATIEQLLPSQLGALANSAANLREKVESFGLAGRAKRLFWEKFFDGPAARFAMRGDKESVSAVAEELLNKADEGAGHVFLIGAGPGSADLLTLRAHKLLANADVVMHDALVSEEVINMSRRDAEIIPVGKRKGCHSKSQAEIDKLLVEKAKLGLKVVRLKAGDPMIFGRAAEEIAALRAANIDYEIVPGITAALAGAADAEIPLTLRGTASSLVFTTGHDLTGDILPDWASLALTGSTVAVYMGRSVARQTASRLIEAGLSQDTPVAVLENIARHNAERLVGTLSDLQTVPDDNPNHPIALIIIGEAVAGICPKKCSPLQLNPTKLTTKQGLAA